MNTIKACNRFQTFAVALAAVAGLTLSGSAANAQIFNHPLALFAPQQQMPREAMAYAPAMPEESIVEEDAPAVMPEHLRRQTVSYNGLEAPGTIVIDTGNTFLYYVLGGGRAIRYGIGVGRDGFRWSGVHNVIKKAEWPDWTPPADMLQRQPYLPRFMAGGPGNPMGARAMYLGNTVYRIHGTNAPSTIGGRVSSGCIRMLNEDVTDLYARVNVGTKVIVLPTTRNVQGQAAIRG